jgi:hypothetical protein
VSAGAGGRLALRVQGVGATAGRGSSLLGRHRTDPT